MVSLNPAFRVGWQIAEAVKRNRGLSGRRARAEAVELLRRVHLPNAEAVARKYPHELSGGMAQRVALARALAGNPRLLIADEPTTALDVTVQAEIIELLRELQKGSDMAVLLVTHNWGIVADICDRVVVMYAGQVVERAPVLTIFDRPSAPVHGRAARLEPAEARARIDSADDPRGGPAAGQLADGVPFPATLRTRARKVRTAHPARTPRGGPRGSLHPARRVGERVTSPLRREAVGDLLLEVRDLAVEYGGGRRTRPTRVVDDVSFSLGRRETLGLVGESGAGKSTIGRAILGLTPIREGEVVFDGRPITHASHRTRRSLSAELQVVFQDPYGSLNPTRTIGQTLAETLRVHGKRGAEAATRSSEMLERVGLPADAAKRYPAHFSGGQRQRIAIARALMVGPRVVICDEPVSALDLSVQAQVLNLLTELQSDLGVSYLFVAHDLAVVRHISHRIIVLYQGRIMEEGPAEVVYTTPSHPYTRTLLEAIPIPDPLVQRRRRSTRTSRAVDGPVLPLGDSCPFAHRCPYVIELCESRRPLLETTPDDSRVACHRWRELRGGSLELARALGNGGTTA